MKLTLQRIDLGVSPRPTFGHIEDDEHNPWCLTLERPWAENQHDVSCIPPGTYTATRFPKGSGKRSYDVFKLSNVPNRSDIELHIGNTIADTEGCIIVGSNYGTVNGQPGVTGSAAAFARLMDGLKGVNTFSFVVANPTPERILV